MKNSIITIAALSMLASPVAAFEYGMTGPAPMAPSLSGTNGVYALVGCPPREIVKRAERLGGPSPCNIITTFNSLAACENYKAMLPSLKSSLSCYSRPGWERVD